MSIELLLLIVIVSALVLVVIGKRMRRRAPKDQAYVRQAWRRIEEMTDCEKAVLEADKLLDKALEKSGYTGTLGEKLKQGGKVFRAVNDVWWAHKLRNRLAHDVGAKVSSDEAAQALRYIRQALRDLRFL